MADQIATKLIELIYQRGDVACAGPGIKPRSHRSIQVVALLMLLVGALSLGSCSTDTQQLEASDTASNAQSGSQQRLQRLARERENDSFASTDFGIGPGDVLDISAADVPELKKRIERVSPQGNIELPIAGSVHVAGLNDTQLHDVINKALAKYVKDPEVDVFVKSFSSRQVAVVGMVNKPGLYTLNRRDETILDMIGHAGGMREGAGSVVLFVPTSGKQNLKRLKATFASADDDAKPSDGSGTGAQVAMAAEERQQMSAERPDKNASAHWSASGGVMPASLTTGNEPIFINVAGGNQEGLDVPVRPGDVIMIPARGQVLVQGWVQNPGAYRITPGMTALGAVTAAGGQLYSSSAVVLRSTPSGQKVELPVDLSKVEKGETPDVQVRSGDVVIVQRSVIGAVPYSLYFLISRFGTGMYLPTF